MNFNIIEVSKFLRESKEINDLDKVLSILKKIDHYKLSLDFSLEFKQNIYNNPNLTIETFKLLKDIIDFPYEKMKYIDNLKKLEFTNLLLFENENSNNNKLHLINYIFQIYWEKYLFNNEDIFKQDEGFITLNNLLNSENTFIKIFLKNNPEKINELKSNLFCHLYMTPERFEIINKIIPFDENEIKVRLIKNENLIQHLIKNNKINIKNREELCEIFSKTSISYDEETFKSKMKMFDFYLHQTIDKSIKKKLFLKLINETDEELMWDYESMEAHRKEITKYLNKKFNEKEIDIIEAIMEVFEKNEKYKVDYGKFIINHLEIFVNNGYHLNPTNKDLIKEHIINNSNETFTNMLELNEKYKNLYNEIVLKINNNNGLKRKSNSRRI